MSSKKNKSQNVEFIGSLVSVTDIPAKGNASAQVNLRLRDDENQSEIDIKFWTGSEGKYLLKKTKTNDARWESTADVKVLQEKSKDSKYFVPSYVLKGKSEMTIYIPDEFIAQLKNIKPNTKLKLIGTMSVTENGGYAPYKNYSINRVELLERSAKTCLKVALPIAFKKESLLDMKFSNGATSYDCYIRGVDSNKTKKWIKTRILADVNKFMDGKVVELAKKFNKDCLELANKSLQVLTNEIGEKEAVIVDCIVNLKLGEITRKPTKEDINPMELQLMIDAGFDDKAIEDFLNEQEVITEKNNDMYIVAFVNDKGYLENMSLNELEDEVSLGSSYGGSNDTMMSEIMKDIGSTTEMENSVNKNTSEESSDSDDSEDEFPFN